MRLPYRVFDVFTDAPYTGNPLAVVEGGAELSTAQMQRIAGEFNLSETVFLLPAEAPEHTARLRIFTPKKELPFAGHPTVGAALALYADGKGDKLTLELGVGPLVVTISDGAAAVRATQPLAILGQPTRSLVANALGLPDTTLAGDPVLASMGVPFVFTPVATRADLARAQADTAAMQTGLAAHPESQDFAQVPYFQSGAGRVDMRMFAPLDGIPEDPATGSAAVALSRLLWTHAGETPLTLDLHQGEDMGRPSVIHTHTEADFVELRGQAVQVMQGTINALPAVAR